VRIDTEIVSGWRTCGADRTMSDTDCPGYESEPCDVVRETITRTFGDRNRGQGAGATGLDPFTCPHCGAPANFTLEPRPSYRRLSPTHPDELVRRARGERQRAEQSMTPAGRQRRAAG
jgi:hypothetical protein